MKRTLAAASLLLLASCRSAPAIPCSRVQAVGAKLGYSAGPPPYYGYYIFGSVPLEGYPPIRTTRIDWRPIRLVGESGSGSFMKDRGRTRIAGRVLYFEAPIGEDQYSRARELRSHDLHVRIDFEGPAGQRWCAEGTLDILKSWDEVHPELKTALADSPRIRAVAPK